MELDARSVDWPWNEPGRDLDPLPIPPADHRRLVVGLNIWEDRAELEHNLPSWLPHVDHVLAVDGAYAGTNVDVPHSTDGTLELLWELPSVEIVPAATFWPDQISKRNAYLERCQPGDLLWIIDADELVLDAQRIREIGSFDIGWLRCISSLYQRAQDQPRVIRWRPGLKYAERHHWMTCHGRPFVSHQAAGPGFSHAVVPITFWNRRGAARSTQRQQAGESRRWDQFIQEEATNQAPVVGHEPLRVLHAGPFDPGMVMHRLHSALNATSPHSSAMVTVEPHPFEAPGQYQFARDRIVRDLLSTADVLHCHVTDIGRHYYADLTPPAVVMHHHGTELRRNPDYWNARDERNGAVLRLASNPELLQYASDMQYLPNPVPVARLRRLGANRPAWDVRPFRIAHSPSKRQLKGTDVFLAVCKRLRAQGLPIEPVLIERRSLRDSLTIKATCHALFDSFWLGMQCSGLEAAAMGLPVIAGDPDCLAFYDGSPPYVYANDEQTLTEAISALVLDAPTYRKAAKRVHDYVTAEHDYGPVVARYLGYLENAWGWRERLQLGKLGSHAA